MKNISEGLNSKFLEISKVTERFKVPENIRKMVEMSQKFQPRVTLPENITKLSAVNLMDSKLYKAIEQFSRIAGRVNNNPELQFALISDLEVLNLKSTEDFKDSLIHDLTDQDIQRKEELLNENLLPLLEKLELSSLWLGANDVLESQTNPDKLRHCLISLRTILEFLIDEKLAPHEELKDAEMFAHKFRRYHLGKQKLEFVKIKREEKIQYFTSKFEYGLLEEFTKDDIQYVCDCYSVLCNVHRPDIGITENQVRSLKVKTGITIWLLVYLYEVLESKSYS